MPKSNFQQKVEELLAKYISHFLRYISFSHIPKERKEILVGTFLYLLDEQDLIPDDVPNIGLFDDLYVFVAAASRFVRGGQDVGGVCSVEEVLEDMAFIEKNKGLFFGAHGPDLNTIQKKGQTEVDIPALCEKIKEKYEFLGRKIE